MPIRNLRMPIKLYEDGSVRVRFLADSALVPASGEIEAVKAKVEVLDRSGKVETVMRAAQIRYNRETGQAHSESDVRLEKGDMVVTGKGLEWSSVDEVVKILSNTQVLFRWKNGGGGAGIFPALPLR